MKSSSDHKGEKRLVLVPRLNANEDEVLIAEVRCQEGMAVNQGEVLFTVETAKSVNDIEAPSSGFVRGIRTREGDTVAVGETLCCLTKTLDEPVEEATSGRPRPSRRRGPTAGERLRRRNAVLSRSPEPKDEPSWVGTIRAALGERSVTTIVVTEQDLAKPSQGLRVGVGVSIAGGSRIEASRIVLGDNVSIGEDVSIRARDVVLGNGCLIASGVSIDTGELLFEEGVRVADGAVVDLSGGRNSDSSLIVGAGSLLAGGCYVNTSRQVLIERRCALSPRAMLFTHSFWQSVLDGYPATFNTIRLRSESWVGAGCQVLPGVEIGSGAVVMSNSTVVEDVPPRCLVAGVPAKVVRRFRKPSEAERRRIMAQVVQEFGASLGSKGFAVEWHSPDLDANRQDILQRRISLVEQGGRIRFLLVRSGDNSECIFDLDERTVQGGEDSFVHEFRNFLRRRGILFSPASWDSDFRKDLPDGQ